MYKPTGYTSLSPYLLLADAEAALTFIKQVFGAEPLAVYRGEERSLTEARLRKQGVATTRRGHPPPCERVPAEAGGSGRLTRARCEGTVERCLRLSLPSNRLRGGKHWPIATVPQARCTRTVAA